MTRHATTEELLELRDGAGSAWTKEHAGSCAECSSELFRLEQVRAQLKALPAAHAPRDRWPVVALGARRERRVRWQRGLIGVAAAAALTALTFAVVRPRDASASERATLDRAMARSQALELQLKALEPEQRALSGEAASAVAALEDQLSSIDAALGDPKVWRNDPGRAAGLWQQRAGVLSALVDVHVTRVAQAGL